MPADPKTKQKNTQAEKDNLLQRILIIAFIVSAVGGIVWMIIASPPEKRLVCSNAPHTLNSFGSCHEE